MQHAQPTDRWRSTAGPASVTAILFVATLGLFEALNPQPSEPPPLPTPAPEPDRPKPKPLRLRLIAPPPAPNPEVPVSEPPPQTAKPEPPPQTAKPEPPPQTAKPEPPPRTPKKPGRRAPAKAKPTIVQATRSVVDKGRQLDRKHRVPGVRLSATHERSYLRFFQRQGGRLFLECGGKLAKEIMPGPSMKLLTPHLDGLDRAHPRVIRGASWAQAALNTARQRYNLTDCTVLLLVPDQVHTHMRHAVLGALHRAAQRPIDDLAQVDGLYQLAGRTATVHLQAARLRDGRPLPLDIEVRF